MDIDEVLSEMIARSASDVYLLAGSPPAFRVNGQIALADGMESADAVWLTQTIDDLLNDTQKDAFLGGHEVDFLADIGHFGRFRGRAAVKSGSLAMVLSQAKDSAASGPGAAKGKESAGNGGDPSPASAPPALDSPKTPVVRQPGELIRFPARLATQEHEAHPGEHVAPPAQPRHTPEPPLGALPDGSEPIPLTGTRENRTELEALLRLMKDKQASDMHLVVGAPPAFRIHGQISIAEDLPTVDNLWLTRNLGDMLGEHQLEMFHNDLELDFAVNLGADGRFRGNAALEKGNISLVFRRITELDLDIESLGLPAVCKQLAFRPRGLVIVTGTVGSGKSTTLAAMIEYINTNARRRIVTLEDPIEYVFANKRSIITQRQVGEDTRSFMGALSRVLRQNPDVIMVGEARDTDTVAAVMTASETGHLVLTTAHAPSAAQTIDGIIGRFPPHQQPQIRTQLASILEAVFYQKLVPRADGKGRVAAVEVMLGTYAIRNLIREGKTHQLFSAMQLGVSQGMQTLDQALLQLCIRGTVPEQAALAICHDPDQLTQELRSRGGARKTPVG